MDGAQERRDPCVRSIAGRRGSQPANGWWEAGLHSHQLRTGEPPDNIASSHESLAGEQAGGNTRAGSVRRVGPARQIAVSCGRARHVSPSANYFDAAAPACRPPATGGSVISIAQIAAGRMYIEARKLPSIS